MRIRTKFSRHSTCRSGVCLPAKIVKGGRQNENLFPILFVAHLVLSMAHLVVRAVPLCPCHPVASVAPLPLCMPPLVYQNRLSFCSSRLGYVQAGPVVSKPPSALPKPSPVPPPPVPPEPPPFSVKTTINRAPKRYFYTPFAPNEKKLRIFALPFRAYINLFHWVPRGCGRRRGRLRRSEAADAGLRIRVSVW